MLNFDPTGSNGAAAALLMALPSIGGEAVRRDALGCQPVCQRVLHILAERLVPSLAHVPDRFTLPIRQRDRQARAAQVRRGLSTAPTGARVR